MNGDVLEGPTGMGDQRFGDCPWDGSTPTIMSTERECGKGTTSLELTTLGVRGAAELKLFLFLFWRCHVA